MSDNIPERYKRYATAPISYLEWELDQAEILSLQSQLNEAIRVIKYYGDTENYRRPAFSRGDEDLPIEKNDHEQIDKNFWSGGRLAREFLAKLKQEGE